MPSRRFAGFWVRTGAALLDTGLLLLAIAGPLTLLYGPQYWDSSGIKGVWDLVLNYVAPALFSVWCWIRFKGTPGKLALRLKVVDAQTGEPLRPGQAAVRYLGYIPSTLVLGLGILWIAFDPKKQGWHDKMAGTVVIQDLREEPVTFGQAPAPTPLAARIEPRLDA